MSMLMLKFAPEKNELNEFENVSTRSIKVSVHSHIHTMR